LSYAWLIDQVTLGQASDMTDHYLSSGSTRCFGEVFIAIITLGGQSSSHVMIIPALVCSLIHHYG
jgi:hypothetical protein